jgi:hypothetical protein
MSYYFVNNKYPISDPNTDLNFNNDILYQHILGDEGRVGPKPYNNANQIPRRARKPSKDDILIRPPSHNIYLLFILGVIVTIMIFYMTRPTKQVSHRSTLYDGKKLLKFSPNLVPWSVGVPFTG